MCVFASNVVSGHSPPFVDTESTEVFGIDPKFVLDFWCAQGLRSGQRGGAAVRTDLQGGATELFRR